MNTAKKLFKWIGLTFAGILAVVIFGLWYLLSPAGIQSIASIATDKVEGLTLAHKSGGLIGPLEIANLRFQNQTIFVDIDNLTLDWSVSCLLALQVCVDSIEADSVNILFTSAPPSEESSAANYDLIKSPVLLLLDTLSLKTLNIYQSPKVELDEDEIERLLGVDVEPNIKLNKLDVSLSFFEALTISRLHISALKLNDQQEVLEEVTETNAERDLKTQLELLLKRLEFQYDGISVPRVFIPLHFALNDMLIASFCVNSEMFCLSNLSLSAKHFDQIVDIELGLSAITTQLKSQRNKEETLSAEIFDDVSDIKLKLNTQLQDNFETKLKLSANSMHYARFDLDAFLDLNNLDMTLSSTAFNNALLKVNGDFDAESKQLPVDLSVLVNEVPFDLLSSWISESDSEQKQSSQVSLLLRGSLNKYYLELKSEFLEVQEIALDSLTTEIELKENQLQLRNILLNGNYKQQTVSARGDIGINSSGKINARGVELTSNNVNLKVNGTGHIFERLLSRDNQSSTMDMSLNIADLSYFASQISGDLQFSAKAQSPLLTPKLQLEIAANNINAEDISLNSAEAKGQINFLNKWSSNLQLATNGLSINGLAIPQINVDLSGDEQDQKLSISIPKGTIQTQQVLTGRLIYPDKNGEQHTEILPVKWLGTWQASSFVYESLRLDSNQETNIEVDIVEQTFAIKEKCWQQENIISVCASAPNVSVKKGDANFESNINFTALLPLLNQEGFETEISRYIDLETSNISVQTETRINWQDAKRPNISQRLSAIDLRLAKGKKAATLNKLEINNHLSSQGLYSDLLVESEDLGGLKYKGRLFQDTPKDSSSFNQHTGILSIEGLTLAKLSPFIPQLERINGVIDGNLTLSNSLIKPSLVGKLSMKNGELLMAEMPLKLSNWQHTFNFDGRKLDSQGEFHLGTYDKGGKATISAAVDFNEGVFIEGTLSGKELALEYEKHYLSVSPDLTFSVSPDLIKLFGDINVPVAKIVIDALPEGTSSPSKDIIVIDQKEQKVLAGPAMIANLNIKIDEHKNKSVKLEAFDLKTALHGDLNLRMINSDINLVGKINLLDGEYKAYGQALSIQQGEISFTGQPEIPNLDIRAIRNPLYTSDEVIAGISVTGTSLEPSVSLFSEPDMDQVKQLSYLLTGRDFDKPGEAQDANTQLVNTLVSFGVGRSENGIGRLGRKLGVDNLNLQAAGVGEDTQVQISGRLSDKIQISYGLGVFDSVSEIKLRYDLLPEVYLEAVSGMQNALDLYYEIERQ